MTAFKFTDTVKKYPDFTLGPLNFELDTGTVLGYVGPNGSGKTTTIHCLMGLVKADGGEMEIFGQKNDPNKPDWKLNIGYVGDVQTFYENWTGYKNLDFLSQFYPDWSMDHAFKLAKRFNLSLDKKAKTLSKGNRVKLALISALAHSPKLLLLDEPTAGLDPVVRSELLDVFFEILEGGDRSIFYSTHVIGDISRIADEIAFLDDGQIKMRSTKDDLTDKWRKISFKFSEKEISLPAVEDHIINSDYHNIISSDFSATMNSLKELGAENIEEQRMSLDEITVKIIRGTRNVETDQS